MANRRHSTRLSATLAIFVVLASASAFVGCKESNKNAVKIPHFDQPMTLGGVSVSAEVLNAGAVGYTQYCRACHGDTGEGNGPAAKGLRPPPRNFTRGVFKFSGTLPRDDSPTLPRDEDLRRIIRSGLHGSAMLGWDVPDPRLDAIIQYLKTFSPKWRTEVPGDPLVPSPDPFATDDAAGVTLGRKLYHSVAQCYSCHASYISKAEMVAVQREMLPDNPIFEFRDDIHRPTVTESKAFSIDGQHSLHIMPPDFTHRELRSVRPKTELPDLYRVISLGINGAAMPPWRDSLKEEQIWALAHYVRSLVDEAGTPEADAWLERVERADKSFVMPGEDGGH
jgi:cytochrome c553